MTTGVELVCIMQGANGWCLLEHGSDNLVIWCYVVLLQAMQQQLVLANNDFVLIFRDQRGNMSILCPSQCLLWNTSSNQLTEFLVTDLTCWWFPNQTQVRAIKVTFLKLQINILGHILGTCVFHWMFLSDIDRYWITVCLIKLKFS